MNTIKFNAGKMSENHTLMRAYKHVDLSYVPRNIRCLDLQELLKNAETIMFGSTKRSIVNLVMPLCENLKEVELIDVIDSKEHKEAAFTFNYTLPVSIKMTACPEFLDRFEAITNISQLRLRLKISPPNELMVIKYGEVIRSLFMGSDRLGNLQLQHLRLSSYYGHQLEQAKITVQSFFRQQAPFIKIIEIMDCIGFYLNPVRLLLSNLEKVRIRCSADLNLCLNDLKVLPKLKCLDFEIRYSDYAENDTYRLDIAELKVLVELRITTYYNRSTKKLRIISRGQPMDVLEKLETFGFHLDQKALEQISSTMPRLKVLTMENTVLNIKIKFFLYLLSLIILKLVFAARCRWLSLVWRTQSCHSAQQTGSPGIPDGNNTKFPEHRLPGRTFTAGVAKLDDVLSGTWSQTSFRQ
jgi:hypothetical protein